MKIMIEGDFKITELASGTIDATNTYDELGWSQIHDSGAISHIKIDELVYKFKNGTKNQRRAVNGFKSLFLFKHPERDYTVDQEYQIYRNMSVNTIISGWSGAVLFDCYLFPAWFKNKRTNEQTNDFKGFSNQDDWVLVNEKPVLNKDIQTCSWGNNSWVEGKYVKETNKNVYRFMDKIVDQAYKQLQDILFAIENPNNIGLVGQ